MIRLFNHYFPVRLALLTLLEGLVLFQSVLVGFYVKLRNPDLPMPALEAALFALVMLTMMSAVGLYQTVAEPFRTTLQRLVVAYGMALIVMSVIFYLFDGLYVSRGVFALSSLFALCSLVMIRLLLCRVTDLGLPKRRVLVLGNGPEAERVIRQLHQGPQGRAIQYAGLYPVSPQEPAAPSDARDPVAQIQRIAAAGRSHDALLRAVRDLRVSEIVIAVRERRGGVLPLRQLLECKLRGVVVMDLVSFHEREHGLLPLSDLQASWLIFGSGFEQGLWRDVVKRTIDFCTALVLLVVSLPALAVAWTALAMLGCRLVLRRDLRVGHGGRTFDMLRLRALRRQAPAAGARSRTGRAALRLVRWLQRSGLSCLPRLLNVMTGDLSLVGPRAESPRFVWRHAQRLPYYEVRHSAKPGLTGWAQVKLGFGASARDAIGRLQYDLYYVKNHTLFLDLMILVESVRLLLAGRSRR
ncbi:MAG TPA: sugar transferase [Burkholderiaceae bacterium]|nr:sugar transferase [Burkholderiaceae bacterium]